MEYSKTRRNSSQHATNCTGATEEILSINFEIKSDIKVAASERVSEKKWTVKQIKNLHRSQSWYCPKNEKKESKMQARQNKIIFCNCFPS